MDTSTQAGETDARPMVDARRFEAVLLDAARLESALARLVIAVRAHNGEQTTLGACCIAGVGDAVDVLDSIHARRATEGGVS